MVQNTLEVCWSLQSVVIRPKAGMAEKTICLFIGIKHNERSIGRRKMGLKDILTLDLENGVSSEKRQKVYDYLKQEKWVKLTGLTTDWRCSFTDNVDRNEALGICKQDVASATRSADVYSYNAAVQVVNGDIEEF